jgi:uncharacterized protein YdeI (YjbR/CyaY-like superfamily)
MSATKRNLTMNRESVDSYLTDGCGRCDRFRTPGCKVHRWRLALEQLRAIVRATGLVETMKWGSPCYTLDGANVVMLVSLTDACALSFLRGAALSAEPGLLESPGPNSRYARYVKFHSVNDVVSRRAAIDRLLTEAIALERSGAKFVPPAAVDELPHELTLRLANDDALRRAFEALTPGRRRSHALHVSGAKQADTRERRVDRCVEAILAGRGWGER